MSPTFDPARWDASDPYLNAVELFNRGCWWEAHEALEDLWRAAGRGTPVGDFLQGLIQLAAALLKHSQASKGAAAGLCRVAAAKLRGHPGRFLGIEGDRLAASVEAYLEGSSTEVPRIALAFPECWSVWREDDHGNRFEVRGALTRPDALRLVADLEAGGHKQSYRVQASAPTRAPR